MNGIVKEGYLEKKSLHLKTFRKRWIVLKGCYLYSFKNKGKYENATEIIDLTLFNDIKRTESDKNYEFELISRDETRRFLASSSDDMYIWMKYIENVINNYIYTKEAKKMENKHNMIKINIFIESIINKHSWTLIICAVYYESEKIKNIIDAINKYLYKKLYPIKYKINYIDTNKSFIDWDKYTNSEWNEAITCYDKQYIINKGLFVKIRVDYQHKIISNDISCKYMKYKKSTNPMDCPLFNVMMENMDELNKPNLNHLDKYIHFKDEYNDKPKCKYNDNCISYKKLKNGDYKSSLLCHMRLYHHPPRIENIKLSQNIQSLIINKSYNKNYDLYHVTDDDRKQYNYNDKNGYLDGLIEEVILNGFKNNLCLNEKDLKENKYSILDIVDDKMLSQRHKLMGYPLNRGEMLSLILYTGYDCTHNLCKSQCNGDYNKWKWFDYCLYSAIYKLSFSEKSTYSVFCGLNKITLNSKSIQCGHFITYVITSYNKNAITSFINGHGIIIQIDTKFKNDSNLICCDVSWISKFPDESHVLFARNTHFLQKNKYKLVLINQCNGIQTFSLCKKSD